MESTQSPMGLELQKSVDWRLYRGMLVTRLFEEALIRWEHEKKISAQTKKS